MKRILLLILVIGMIAVSFAQEDSSQEEFIKFQISEAINDIEDEIEWLRWDIEEGNIDKDLGEMYMSNFMTTRNRLFLVYQSLSIKENK